MSVQEQDKILLNDILERNYYYYYKQENSCKHISISLNNNNNYNNSIFNKQKIKNIDEQIIDNFNIFLNWYKKNDFKCDLFIEDDEWFFNQKLKKEIFTILFNNFILNKNKRKVIIKFNNLELINENDLIFLEEQINILKEKNIDLIINFFIDINLINNKFIIEKILEFCKKNNFLIYNIINSQNVILQKSFYNYLLNFIDYSKIILIEQEDEKLEEKNINIYIDFINTYIEYLLQLHENSNNFIEFLLHENSIISLKDKGIVDNSQNCQQNCNFYKNLHIIINDFSLTMCKKIQYDELIIGYFNKESEKFIPNNISALILSTHLKHNMTPQCEYCYYNALCPGFCHGDAYYKTLNPLIPIRETCLLKKAKYSFLFYKLYNLNYYELLLNNIKNNNYKEYIKLLFDNIKNNLN